MRKFHSKYIRVNPWYKSSKFKLTEDSLIKTDIVGFEYEDDKVKLDILGNLTGKKNFEFGASGPTLDTENSREGSCYHDLLYHISKMGGFDKASDNYKVRLAADELIYRLCRYNGMWELRAGTWFCFLRTFGEAAWNDKQYKY